MLSSKVRGADGNSHLFSSIFILMNATSPNPAAAIPQQEEAARADMYGLLAMLFFNPPQAPLLAAIAGSASQGESLLGEAWASLADACRQRDETQVHDEYHQLFIGVSKPEIMLYGSYYQSGFLMEKPLAELRADLSVLGLARSENVEESEDHVASLFEVMRILILSSESPEASLSKQRQFYAAHIQSWIGLLCDAIEEHPQADFYRNVANLTRQFIDIENQAFDMN
jgi:TorA maturation chaperone TorD